MSVKQAIILRRKYPDGNGGTKNISWGKACAQVAHASMWWLMDRLVQSGSVTMFGYTQNRFGTQLTGAESEWLASGEIAKICLQVDTEEELDTLYNLAINAGLLARIVVDHGHTEFGGIHTKTCLAIGPNTAETVDKITQGLKLL